MASVQSAHMNYDPLAAAGAPPSGTKRKIGDVGVSPGNEAAAETPGSQELSGDGESGEARGDMSESKRRAQNRAAQRAFRERKERHLKELETRLAQLESESRSWKSTNMALRSQLSLLEEELQHYRRPKGPEAAGQGYAAGTDVDTRAQGLPAHMVAPPRQGPPGSAGPAGPAGSSYAPPQAPAHDARSGSSHNGNSPDSLSIPGLSFDSPGSAASSTPNRADEFCDKLSLACGTRDRPVPIGAPQIAAESPRWQEDAVLNGMNADWGRNNSWGGLSGFDTGLSGNDVFALPEAAVDPVADTNALGYSNAPPTKIARPEDSLNLDFGILANGFGNFGAAGDKPAEQPFNMPPFQTNNMSGLLNADYGMFDPLEDMLEWNPGKDAQSQQQPQLQQSQQQIPHAQPQQPQQSQQPQQPQYGTVPLQRQQQQQRSPQQPHQSQISRQPHTSQTPAPPRPAGAGVSPRGGAQDPQFKSEHPDVAGVGLGFFGNAKDMGPLAGLEEQVPAASQRFIPCSDVWDRICSHPRFGEIDINSMCQELRSHARCSNTGVVLDEEDVNKVLGTIE